MFSERIPSWAKIFNLLTGTVKAIAISVIPDASALHSAGPDARSYRSLVHQLGLETQREWAMANARLINLNR